MVDRTVASDSAMTIWLLATNSETRTGHWGVFYEALSGALLSRGHSISLIDYVSDPSFDLGELIEAAEPGRPDLVFRYEGKLSEVADFERSSRLFPDVTFVLNFFFNEGELGNHRTLRPVVQKLLVLFRHFFSGSRRAAEIRTGEQPRNLVFTAETDQRAFFARARGISVDRALPIFSNTLHQFASRVASEGPAKNSEGPRRYKAVIPLSSHQIRSAAASLFIVYPVSLIYTGKRWVFSLLCPDPEKLPWFHGLLLALFRVQVVKSSLEPEDYFERLNDANVAILPYSDFYIAQSSGKSLDCLAAGLPVLAPTGTFPHRTMETILPGFPGFRSVSQLARLIHRWPQLEPFVRNQMTTSSSLHELISPKTLVNYLMEIHRRRNSVS